MRKIAYYDAATGFVGSLASGPVDAEFPAPAEGQLAVDVTVSARLPGFIGVDGFCQLPERPSASHVFSIDAQGWVDGRSLADFKAEKWANIKALRSAVEFGGFDWDGSRFDSDAISQSRITGAVQLAQIAGEGWSIDWTLADNRVRTLSAADMIAVGVSLGRHVGTAHDIARGLRERIEVAESVAELDGIAWPA